MWRSSAPTVRFSALGSICASGSARRPGSASPIEHVLELVENYALPVVAVVQGDAIAGGNELALHCDFVVAASGASFGMSLAQIGLAPSWFLAKKLLEVAGPVAARRILLLGDPIQATRMAELGIIDPGRRPKGSRMPRKRSSSAFAANAPLSLANERHCSCAKWRSAAASSTRTSTRSLSGPTSDDSREGIAARLEKRAPKFCGM